MIRGDDNNAIAVRVALALLAAGLGSACTRTSSGGGQSVSDGLVFIRVVNESNEVMRVRISDGEVRAITATPQREERWPYWSEPAGRLVFQSGKTDQPNDSDLMLWDPQTGRASSLFATPEREERWPGWSPDGTSLVYAFRGGRPRAGVAVVNLAEKRMVVIASSTERDFFLRPNYSPDGRLLVAQRRIPENRGSNLWILSGDAPPRRLTTDPDWFDMKAWFTRDGSRIVYTRRTISSERHEIVSVSAGGEDIRPLVRSGANDHSARPSPTRDEIVFVSDRDGSSDVFLADLTGGAVRNLRRSPETNELAPRWSPDGERIVVTRVDRELGDFGSMKRAAIAQARIVVLDREGNEILDTPGTMADWMPPWP